MTSEWPLAEPELLERLRADDEAFTDLLRVYATALGARPYTPDDLAHACGYPWPRPAKSFTVRDDGVEPFDPSTTAGRHPLLAVGSNAAPWRLAGKLAHFDDPADRLVPVECGVLEDFDVGAAATVSLYGSMCATPFPSPGTRARLAVLHVTDNQLEQLTWSEISYRFGRLTDVTFAGEPRTLYAYVARVGTFAPDGEPIALAAVGAEHRTAPALTQPELLDRAAALLGEPDGEAVVRALFADTPAMLERLRTAVWPHGLPFADPRWTPLA